MSVPSKSLEEMVREACDAWPKSSPEELSQIYTEDILVIDPTDPVRIRGKEKLREWFANARKAFGNFSSTKMLHFEQVAENVAYYEFIATYTPEGGEEQHIIFRAVLVCEQVDGEWKGKFEQWDGYPCDAQGKRLSLSS